MKFDANRPDLTIGVLGTGAMGRGIVQVAAAGGMNVVMMDTRASAADEARDFIAKMLARAAAFIVNGRHAGDYERFACEGNRLLVEIRDGARVERTEFNPHWVRMLVSRTRRETRIALAAHGRELEVGRHLDDAGRALLARELDGQIALMRAPASRGIAG